MRTTARGAGGAWTPAWRRFWSGLTPSLGRPDRRRQARTYVAGLLLEGERKSVQPLAGRLGATDNGQALHHFIAHSPWACEGLLRRDGPGGRPALAAAPRLDHRRDELSQGGPPLGGRGPPVLRGAGQDRQLPGGGEPALRGRHAGPGRPAPRLGWRLFLPREWIDDPARRQKAGVPESIAYRSKNALALELVDEALARGLPPAPVLADSDYGDDYSWRAALRERGRGLLRGGRTPRQSVDERAGGLAPARRRSARAQGPAARPQTPGPDRARVARPQPGAPSLGARARVDPCRAALRGCRSGPATATRNASTGANAPASGS